MFQNEQNHLLDYIWNLDHCKKNGIPNPKIIEINGLTDGQATTAMAASPYWNMKNSLLIYNIDTYIEAGEMKAEDLKGAGFIPCFEGEGDHWSFVKIDSDGKAIEVAEKKRISPNCSLGAYYFSSCSLYQNLYTTYYVNPENLTNGEKYIAPLYNLLISQKEEVYISNIPTDKVHPLGTPNELAIFLAK